MSGYHDLSGIMLSTELIGAASTRGALASPIQDWPVLHSNQDMPRVFHLLPCDVAIALLWLLKGWWLVRRGRRVLWNGYHMSITLLWLLRGVGWSAGEGVVLE